MSLHNSQSNGDVLFLLPPGRTHPVTHLLLMRLKIHIPGSIFNPDIGGLRTNYMPQKRKPRRTNKLFSVTYKKICQLTIRGHRYNSYVALCTGLITLSVNSS